MKEGYVVSVHRQDAAGTQYPTGIEPQVFKRWEDASKVVRRLAKDEDLVVTVRYTDMERRRAKGYAWARGMTAMAREMHRGRR